MEELTFYTATQLLFCFYTPIGESMKKEATDKELDRRYSILLHMLDRCPIGDDNVFLCIGSILDSISAWWAEVKVDGRQKRKK